MIRAFIFALGFLASSSAIAQQNQCRTSPVGASTPYCASEAFVTESMADGVTGPVSSTSGDLPSFADSSGKALADSGISSTIATKAQQQAGTSAVNIVTPSQQQSHDSAAKAWAFFTTTGSNGAQTLNQAYNISAITRNALGSYSASFSPTPFASSTSFGCTASAYVSPADIFAEFGSSGISTTNINFFFRTITAGAPAGADPVAGFIECLGRQ